MSDYVHKLPRCHKSMIPIFLAAREQVLSGEYTISDICRNNRISVDTLRKWRIQCGLPPAKPSRYRVVVNTVIQRRYESGEDINAIARCFNVSRSTVRHWAKTNGWKGQTYTPANHYSPELVAKARDLFSEGFTLEEIGKAIGCYRTTVGTWSRRFNWPRTCRPGAGFGDHRKESLT